ncbi:tyrosine-type recombinase/integrase [Noviherbaspirillum sp. ST9]|uniref:tyrosine-type recombinase/integrase n=1 Tax=Noviherbaspirillum sp. ST9 TaxID=3401606 RepID=UPI003B585C60
MAAQKLTATKIEKYKPTKADESLSDGNGLSLRYRVGTAGRASRIWMYAYKADGKSVYLTLGDYLAGLPEFDIAVYGLTPGARLTLETARKIAQELTDWRKRKLDPKQHLAAEQERRAVEAQRAAQEEAARRKQAEIDNLTVNDLFDAWLQDGVRRHDGNAELKRSFGADVLPQIGKKAVRHITEHDARAVLRAMVARGVNRAAVVMRNNLTQMFAWAEKRQPWRTLLVDGNPMDLIEIEKIVSLDYDLHNERARVLSAAEIRELHAILEQAQADYDAAPNKRIALQPLEPPVQCALWIMLATLCRVGELLKTRWEHIDFEAGIWRIPRPNVKGKTQELVVSLSPFAHAQFKRLHAITGGSDWCFPSRLGEGHVNEKAISKQVGDRQAMFKRGKDGAAAKPLKHRRHDNSLVLSNGKNGAWTPHDLRRTGATLMQSLAVQPDIIDRCQNHVIAGSKVRRHYLHHDYAQEKREAWNVLGQHLAKLLARDDNVVALPRRA